MKIVFIVPYYGEFPNYFNLFLETCKNNKDFDWLVITDIKKTYNYPPNVRLLDLSWEALKELLDQSFDFKISIDSPYKLCDFKPAYGYIFRNYIEEYDYWGYCDVDVLFGDLRKFLPDNKLEKYDKIGHLGHMSIYRNCDEINFMFAKDINKVYRYKEVFTSNLNYMFDEWNMISINHIFLHNKKRILMFNDFFDIYPYDDNFKRVYRIIPSQNMSFGKEIIDKKISFASIEKGKAYQWTYTGRKWNKTEVAYIHFQKRKMDNMTSGIKGDILCVPNKFIQMNSQKIPKKFLLMSLFNTLYNKRKYKWYLRKIIFQLASTTSSLRHPFRK